MNEGPLTTPQKFELRQMREAGVPMRECEIWFGKSRATLHRALRDLREKMGPEHMKKRSQYARLHLTHRTSQASE